MPLSSRRKLALTNMYRFQNYGWLYLTIVQYLTILLRKLRPCKQVSLFGVTGLLHFGDLSHEKLLVAPPLRVYCTVDGTHSPQWAEQAEQGGGLPPHIPRAMSVRGLRPYSIPYTLFPNWGAILCYYFLPKIVFSKLDKWYYFLATDTTSQPAPGNKNVCVCVRMTT